ncbi:uncharacterized protein B4U80_13954 [Leptotrombidium deliense]|uniref:Ig-like domain-containing protein n=1 Tax=Leptotrombidium deliense TaxID=299467 RepID=A0A443S6N9_9ACAR|nr:uncharacterized protein B4U80_13954 [Leptotrombidium deliense]
MSVKLDKETIWQSKPNLNLTWSVRYRESDGLSISMINISFYVSGDNDMMSGPLNLKCSSIVSQIYGNAYEELISDDRVKYPMRVNIRKNILIPPQINGISSRYKVGDHLSVNCTAPDWYPPPVLTWIVNDKEAKEKQLLRYNMNAFYSFHKTINFSSTIYDHFAVFEKTVNPVLGLTFKVTEEHYQFKKKKISTKEPMER